VDPILHPAQMTLYNDAYIIPIFHPRKSTFGIEQVDADQKEPDATIFSFNCLPFPSHSCSRHTQLATGQF